MGPSDFARHLAQDSIAPVYLFKGDADFLMEEAWMQLVEKIVPAKARRFNGERMPAREYSADQVLARLNTLPMFGPKQLIMVQHVDSWVKEQRNAILSYLERPQPSSCLVLTSSQKKGTEKLESAVTGVGKVVHFPTPTEREAPRWLQERARSQNKLLTPRTAVYLLDLVGLDLHRLERELEKLSAYVGEREAIEIEDVKQVVGAQRTFSVFELLNFVSRQQSSRAVFSLRNLIVAGEAPLAILALLSRQLRIMWQVKDGENRGLSSSEIRQQLNLPAAAARKYTQQASLFDEGDLRRIHHMLRETDLAIKSTGTPPDLILEALVLRLCHSKQKSP